MPRRTSVKSTGRKGSSAPERGGKGERRKSSAGVSDEQVLELRETGASFSGIARVLELPRAGDAHAAFLRALRSREGDDRRVLVGREAVRLDVLEGRIRSRDAEKPERMTRRLAALEVLRDTLPS